MKRFCILFLLVCVGYTTNTVASEISTSDTPQNYVQVICSTCGGRGTVFVGYNQWGYPICNYCANCQGRGWIIAHPSPHFKGDSTRNSCNIRDHQCTGGKDRNNDGWCDVCYSNGYRCHMTKHQPR